MKLAILIDNGITQLIATPESPLEKQLIASCDISKARVSVHRGEFYACRGGWNREGSGTDSLIIRLDDTST